MKNQATEEQMVYAGVLDKGMKLGLLILIVTFIIYIFGIFQPHIPIEDLPKFWGMKVHDYLAETHVGTGWSWVGLLGKGDFINFIPIAFLAGITMLCYLSIIPIFRKKGDKVFATLAIIEIAVLLLAASGILKGGGH